MVDINNSNLYSLQKLLNIAEQKEGEAKGITQEDTNGEVSIQEFNEVDVNHDEILEGSEISQLRDAIEEYEEEQAAKEEAEEVQEEKQKTEDNSERKGIFGFFKEIFSSPVEILSTVIDINNDDNGLDIDLDASLDDTDEVCEKEPVGQEIVEQEPVDEGAEINPETDPSINPEAEVPANTTEPKPEEKELTPQQKLLNKLKEGKVAANIEAKTTGLGQDYTGYIRLSKGVETADGEWPTELVMSMPQGIKGNMVLRHQGNGEYVTSAKDRNFTVTLNDDGTIDVKAANVEELRGKLEANQAEYKRIAEEKARQAELEKMQALGINPSENGAEVVQEFTCKSLSNEKVTFVRMSDGIEYYVDENGNKLSIDDTVKIMKDDAKNISDRMYKAASGMGTDEKALDKSVADIYSKNVFGYVNDNIRAKSKTYDRKDMTPVEALLLDEKTHKAARPNFQTLADNNVMTTSQQATMAQRELNFVIEGRTKTASVKEVLSLIGDKPEVRKAVDEKMKQNPPARHNVSADEESYIRGVLASDGFDAREVDMFDAHLIEQDAYGEDEQDHINNVTGRLVFEHSDKNNNEARHVGMQSVHTDATRQYVEQRAQKENEKKGYKAQFSGQDALQTYLAGENTGADGQINTGEISACNTLLYKGEKPARIQAEELLYKAKNNNDVGYIFSERNQEVYAEIETIVQEDGLNGVHDMDELYQTATTQNSAVDNMQIKANAVINGTVQMNDEELADFCISLMHDIDFDRGRGTSSGYNSRDNNLANNKTEQLKTILSNNPQILSIVEEKVNNGNFSYTTQYMSANTFQENGGPAQVIRDEHDTKAIYQELLKNNSYYDQESVFLDENGNKITDKTQIEALTQANKQSLQGLRDYVAQLEREFNMTVDTQGVLSEYVNALSEFSGLGTDREDVRSTYLQAKTLLSDMEKAAEGKLRDKDGNVISAQDLAQNVIQTQEQLSQTNANYDQTIQTGKMVIIMAPVMAASIVATGGASAVGMGALGSAAVGGTAAGGTMYGLTAAEYNSSLTGKTTEAKEQNLEDSAVNGGLTGLGIGVGGGVMSVGNNITSNFTRGAVRYGAQVASDIGSGMAAEFMQTGDLSVEGTTENVAMALFGNMVGAKQLGQKSTPKVHADVNVGNNKGDAHLVQKHTADSRNVVREGEIAANIDQRHLNANQRALVDEAVAETPTSADIAAWQQEIEYRPVSQEDMPAYQAHQEKVAADYAEAHQVQNMVDDASLDALNKAKAEIDGTAPKETPQVKPMSDEVSAQVKQLENEIKGIDGSIKNIEKQIEGAKKFGKDTSKLEKQLENLQTKRNAKASELADLKNPPVAQTPVAEVEIKPEPVETPVVKAEVEVKPEPVEAPVVKAEVEVKPEHVETPVVKAEAEVKPEVVEQPKADVPDAKNKIVSVDNPSAKQYVEKSKYFSQDEINNFVNYTESDPYEICKELRKRGFEPTDAHCVRSGQLNNFISMRNPESGVVYQYSYDTHGNLRSKIMMQVEIQPDGMWNRLSEVSIGHNVNGKPSYKIYEQTAQTPNAKPGNVGSVEVKPEVVAPKVNTPDAEPVLSYITMQRGQAIEIQGSAELNLAKTVTVDLNAPDIKAKIDNLPEGGRLTIGREGDIQVNDPTNHVSREHAIISKRNGKIYVIDNNSTNGTILKQTALKVETPVAPKVNTPNAEPIMIHDCSNLEIGSNIPQNQPLNLGQNTKLKLADTVEIDLNSPEIQSRIKNLKNGEKFTIGRDGDIVVNDPTNHVSRNHLEIENIDGNIVVRDISSNGTKISGNAQVNPKADISSTPHAQTSNTNTPAPKTKEEALALYDKLVPDTENSNFMFNEGFVYEVYPEYQKTGIGILDMDNMLMEAKSEWKIHVYADSPQEWADVAEVAMPYLQDNKLIYKTMSTLEDAEFDLMRTTNGGTQKGKAFTIYFRSEEEFVQTAKALEGRFAESGLKSSGTVGNEAQIGESGFLSYRHDGAERGGAYKPDGVNDPLKNQAAPQAEAPAAPKTSAPANTPDIHERLNIATQNRDRSALNEIRDEIKQMPAGPERDALWQEYIATTTRRPEGVDDVYNLFGRHSEPTGFDKYGNLITDPNNKNYNARVFQEVKQKELNNITHIMENLHEVPVTSQGVNVGKVDGELVTVRLANSGSNGIKTVEINGSRYDIVPGQQYLVTDNVLLRCDNQGRVFMDVAEDKMSAPLIRKTNPQQNTAPAETPVVEQRVETPAVEQKPVQHVEQRVEATSGNITQQTDIPAQRPATYRLDNSPKQVGTLNGEPVTAQSKKIISLGGDNSYRVDVDGKQYIVKSGETVKVNDNITIKADDSNAYVTVKPNDTAPQTVKPQAETPAAPKADTPITHTTEQPRKTTSSMDDAAKTTTPRTTVAETAPTPNEPKLIDKRQRAAVTELPPNKSLYNISKSGIKDGGVFTQNGQLYIRNGNEAVALDISPETFERLFPHESLNFQQGKAIKGTNINRSTSTCWFLSTAENAFETPQGKTNILKLFSEDADGNVSITFQGKRPIEFKKGNPIDIGIGVFPNTSDPGVALLEQAQAINNSNLNTYQSGNGPVKTRKLGRSDIKKIESDLSVKRSSREASKLLGGKPGLSISYSADPDKFIEQIRTYGNDPNRKLQVIYGVHERAIKGYEVIDGIEYVYISDPEKANLFPQKVSIDKLMQEKPWLEWVDYGTITKAPEAPKVSNVSQQSSASTQSSQPTQTANNFRPQTATHTPSGLKIPEGCSVVESKVINGQKRFTIKSARGSIYFEQNGRWVQVI